MAEQKNIYRNIVEQKNTSLAERVADQLDQLIIAQDLHAGDKLPNEFDLAERLNVGRGTIREAVKLLVSRNVLEIRRGRGTFVAEKPGRMLADPLGFAYTDDQKKLAMDLMEIRLRMEPWIAELAAERITEEEMPVLREKCAQVEYNILHGIEHRDSDIEMHKFLASCTHNTVITELIPIITYSVSFLTQLKEPDILETTIRTHRGFVEAVCNHDKEQAVSWMEEHILSNKRCMDALEEEGREFHFQKVEKW